MYFLIRGLCEWIWTLKSGGFSKCSDSVSWPLFNVIKSDFYSFMHSNSDLFYRTEMTQMTPTQAFSSQQMISTKLSPQYTINMTPRQIQPQYNGAGWSGNRWKRDWSKLGNLWKHFNQNSREHKYVTVWYCFPKYWDCSIRSFLDTMITVSFLTYKKSKFTPL